MEISDKEDLASAVTALNALGQENRLATFRALIEAGRGGMAAGAIAKRLGVAPSSLSFHLSTLKHAGLVSERRESRSKIYTANYDAMSRLIAFLMTDCCAADQVDPQLINTFANGEQG